ncbi:MAG: Tic22 family protein [Cyanobacteria bacterium P01_C01_bin.73]
MNFLSRSITTVGLLGSILATSLTLGLPRAIALETETVVEQLSTVPVFILVDSEGNPLLASGESEEAPLVFMERQGAEAFIAAAQEDENAAFSDDAQIAVIWLSDLYQRTSDQIQSGATGPDGRSLSLDFIYVPSFNQLRLASQFNEEFSGVPVFVVRFNDDDSLLTINTQNESEPIIPMFLDLQDMQPLLDRLEEQGLAEQISVSLVSLESVLDTLEETSDETYGQIRFFPSSDVVTDIFGDNAGDDAE